MSPIVDLQARFRELGRLRLGEQVAWEKNGRSGTRPGKLDTWRLTSPSKALLDRAATIYEGDVQRWTGEQVQGEEWELITKSKTLDILIPPGLAALTQWNEMWSGGGCVRRCDGRREYLSDSPCLCDPDPAVRNELAQKGEACKPTTRLSVILPNIPDIGTWLLTTHGYYAAVELQGTINLIQAAGAAGRMVKASLRIDQRQVKRPGVQTHQFPVPVIEIAEAMGDLIEAGGMPGLLAAGPTRPPTPTAEVPLPADPRFPPAPFTVDGPAEFRMPSTEAPPPPLTYAEFRRLINDSQMDLERVGEAHKRRFPTGPSTKDITDEQRGRLWADLTRVPVQETPAAPSRPVEPSAAPPVGDVPVVSGEVIEPNGEDHGLSLAQLTDALHADGRAFKYAEARAKERFGVDRLDALSNAQRLELAAALELPV